MRYLLITLLSFATLYACHTKQNNNEQIDKEADIVIEEPIREVDTIIIDSYYTFAEAIESAGAPQSVIDKLELIDVTYT